METQGAAIAEAAQEQSALQHTDDALTPEALMRSLAQTDAEPEAEPEQPVEDEQQEESPKTQPEVEAGETEEEGEGEQEDGLLERLTPEQLEQIAEELNSRAADRIAGLVREKKALQERLLANQDSEPALAEPEAENPFKEVAELDELQTKYKEVTEFVDWAEDLLDDHEDDHGDEVIHEEDGKEFTKKAVRKALRAQRKARDQFLPARARELQQVEARKAQAQAFRDQAAKQFTWMAEEDNSTRQQWEDVMSDPDVAALAQSKPELALIMAHAADSIARTGKPKAKPAPLKPVQTTPEPAPNPSSGAAPSSRPEAKRAKMLTESYAAFEETGSPQALQNFLVQQQRTA
jgi:hypothetical protein